MDGKIDWPCDVYPPGPGFHSPADSHVSQRPVQNRYGLDLLFLDFSFIVCYTFYLTVYKGLTKITKNEPILFPNSFKIRGTLCSIQGLKKKPHLPVWTYQSKITIMDEIILSV